MENAKLEFNEAFLCLNNAEAKVEQTTKTLMLRSVAEKSIAPAVRVSEVMKKQEKVIGLIAELSKEAEELTSEVDQIENLLQDKASSVHFPYKPKEIKLGMVAKPKKLLQIKPKKFAQIN